MAEYLIQDTTLTAIADAIRAKSGTTKTLTPDAMINVISSISSKGDVTFYDYDGTVVTSYTIEEAQALTSLPDGPTHYGLVFQGWNWPIEKINSLNRPMNIGAMYITDDGKTRLHIGIADKARSTVPLYISQTVENGITIDWGDGSSTETLSGTGNVNTTHAYGSAGDYTITLDTVGGCVIGLGHGSSKYCVMGSTDTNNTVYCNMLQSVNIGNSVTDIGNYAFSNCYSLSSVTIPNSVTDIGNYAFSNCYSLSRITIPNSVTRIGNYAFSNCYSLSSVTIPNSVTDIGNYTFNNCYSLSSVIIPNSVTIIGSCVFDDCCSLSRITIPNSVTDIGSYAFSNCYSLSRITIPNSVTIIDGNAFSNCYSLSSVTIPNSVTDIGNYAFSNCYSLSRITIPNSVTRIGNYAFSNCYSLSSVTIPNSVTYINFGAFQDCTRVSEYHILNTTPPTLSSKEVFNGISSDCIIYVPQGCLEVYQNTTIWGSYASYMREEPA